MVAQEMTSGGVLSHGPAHLVKAPLFSKKPARRVAPYLIVVGRNQRSAQPQVVASRRWYHNTWATAGSVYGHNDWMWSYRKTPGPLEKGLFQGVIQVGPEA